MRCEVRATCWCCLTALFLSNCGSDDSGPSVSFSGQAADPSGDGGTADLIFASLEVIGSNIKLRAEVTPGSFHRDSLLVVFNLDADEQAATGYTTANPGHSGLGIDCLIELGKVTPGILGARVRSYENGVFITAASAEVTSLSQGYEATVPLGACGDDGQALMRIEAFRQVSAQAYTIRQDWLPDPIIAPIAVR